MSKTTYKTSTHKTHIIQTILTTGHLHLRVQLTTDAHIQELLSSCLCRHEPHEPVPVTMLPCRFSSCLGSKYAVRVTVMSCRAPGVPTIRARLMRPGQSQDLQLTGWYNALASALEPASLLDVASVDMEGAVDAIRRAEAALVYRTQWLSAKIKDLAAVQWQVRRAQATMHAYVLTDQGMQGSAVYAMWEGMHRPCCIHMCWQTSPGDAPPPVHAHRPPCMQIS